MIHIQSQFEESPEQAIAEPAAESNRLVDALVDGDEKPLPPRKWSLMILAAMMFALVWFREFTGMSPGATMGVAMVLLLCWVMVHLTFFVKRPEKPVAPPEEIVVQKIYETVPSYEPPTDFQSEGRSQVDS